jgi:hypothetical protein
MTEKLYKNKEWLKYQIEVLGKSQKQIGEECGVNRNTIHYWYAKEIQKYAKECALKNKEKQRKKSKKNYNDNKEKIRILHKIYRSENKEKIKLYHKKHNQEKKIKVLNILGGCVCAVCGDTELSHLTIDHIDETGYIDIKNGLKHLYDLISKRKYPRKKISNLRVLCYNCNCSRTRKYLNLLIEDQSSPQKYQTKLWKEAFSFFGPCKTCGDSDLIHLTISHIHNDGAEKRRNGEGKGVDLLVKFRKLGWAESLKQDYCLECWNCNCSQRFKKRG